jgi:hypothetical protein
MQPLPPSDEVWALIPTADPGEVVYRAVVSKDAYMPRQLHRLMTLRDAPTWIEKPRVSDFGSYVLTTIEPGPPGWLYVFFAMPRTDDERNTPVKSWFDTGVETFPAILEGLRLVEDPSQPIALATTGEATVGGETTTKPATVYVPRRLVFYAMTPQTTAECQVKVEVYQSEVPFEGLASPRPIPGNVNFDFGAGGSGSFTALHPKIVIPRSSDKYIQMVDATPGFADAAMVLEQVFPATEFEDWEPFVWRTRIQEVNGLWVKERAIIYPPDKPDTVYS